jgi:hypothetical protein
MAFVPTILSQLQIEELLGDRPPVIIPGLDDILPPVKWKGHPFAEISINLVTRTTGNLPLTRPGGPGFPIPADFENIKTFRPMEARFVDHLDAATVRRYEGLHASYLATEKAAKYQNMRDDMRFTRGAMLWRALLTGNYTYFVNQSMGVALDTTSLGTPATGTVTVPLDNAAATYGTIQAAWDTTKQLIAAASGNRFGQSDSNLVYYVADGVWAALCELIAPDGASQQGPLPKDGAWISINGMTWKKASGSYTTFSGGTTGTSPYITAKYGVMVDLGADHKGRYCAVDDLDANPVDTDFFAKEWMDNDPSGIHLLAAQKPFVAPDMRGVAVVSNLLT